MDMEHSKKGNVTLLKFHGELDATGVPAISELDSLVEQGATRFVFNIQRLTFIDSSGIAFFIETLARLRESQGELVLSEPSKFFQTVISTLSLERIFKIFPTDEVAFKYFDGADGGGVLPESQPPDLG